MQFEPPTKPDEVAVPMTRDGANTSSRGGSSQGVDANGLVLGRWKSGVFNCFESLVPNGVMSCICPGLVVAQVSARLGMLNFWAVLAAFAALNVLAITTAAVGNSFLSFLLGVACLIAVLCCMRMRWRIRELFGIPGSHLEDATLSLCCGCCSVAQMASHVEAYEPGRFAFAPRATLEGYTFV